MFSTIYEGEPASRLIYKTENFRLIADLSPLTVGHLLLLPVEHYFSFAQVVEELESELTMVLCHIEPMYRETFGAFTVLEHGSFQGMRSSACISHAHWHILPLDGRQINELILGDGLVPTVLTDRKQLAIFNDAPYFLCLFDGELHVYRARNPMRNQYLRSVVGNIVGIDDPLWDYALVTRTELLRETVARTSIWRLSVDSSPA